MQVAAAGAGKPLIQEARYPYKKMENMPCGEMVNRAMMVFVIISRRMMGG